MSQKPDWTLESNTPRRFAVLLYRQWESIDVMGPLEALNTLSRNAVVKDDEQFELSIITRGGVPASTAPQKGPGSLVNQQIIATHGYPYYDPAHPDADLLAGVPEVDFLLVPGGLGPPAEERAGVVEFIKQYNAKYLQGQEGKYLFTVCTGSGLAAQAGCLDKMYATTNKAAWDYITKLEGAENTYWVADARWVEFGSTWTTSGVSAGTDGMLAWMAKVYGQSISDQVTLGMEYIGATNSGDDPFGVKYARTDVPGDSGLPPPGK